MFLRKGTLIQDTCLEFSNLQIRTLIQGTCLEFSNLQILLSTKKMETSSTANEKIATPALENVPTLSTDETLHTHPAPDNDKLSESSSVLHDGSAVSEPLMELSSSGKANPSSDPMAMDQPAVDCQSKRTSSGPERKLTLGEDPAAMTIEFLRARLLSERAISKSAKQQTEQLAKKVIELERILQAEVERKRLSQIAAEQALTKLQNAGVHLDSKQLDIFVREFDSRKEAPNYQDKGNTVGFSESESSMNSSLKSQRVHNVRGSEDLELNNQYDDANTSKPDQILTKPQSDPKNHELERDENGGGDNPVRLSENEGLDLQALSPASDTLRPVPVRGIGRSCRTFKKRHTSEPLLESWNDLVGEDIACLSENQNKEEQESSDLSGWVNHVVDMFDGNSRKNSSSSSESGWTDLGQSDTADFDCEKEQYPSEKNNFRSSTNQVHRQASDALKAQLYDASSTELLAEQKVKTYSGQNAEESEAGGEVEKLLEHRAEFIALNQSQENAQMLWEQQHSSPSTSEQSADLQSNLPVDNLEISVSHKLDAASNSMLQEQEEKSEPEFNTLQLQGQELKVQNVVRSSSLETPNFDDSGSSISDQERQCYERMAKSIREPQSVEEDKTHILTEQLELTASEIEKTTHILAREEQPPVHLANGSNELLKKTSADVINCDSKGTSVSNTALNTHHPTAFASQSIDLCLAHEDKSLDIYTPGQVDADSTSVKCAAQVNYCTGHAAAGEGEEMIIQGLSTDCFLEASHRNGYSQNEYSSDSNDFNSHENVVDTKGGIKKDKVAGNWTGENSWAGIPLKADLQRQASHNRDVLESFQNSNTSHILRNSKKIEVPQGFGGYLEEHEKHSWKPSSSDNLYKDVLNRGQGHEHAAGTDKERPERTLLHQDQLYLQRSRPSDPLFPFNSFRLLYEASLKRQQESDNHMRRKEAVAAPYSVHMSRQHSLESYTSEFPSRHESHMHFKDERAQKVLMALRLAKEQIRESIDQRQFYSECAKARTEDFQMAVGARDYSYNDYHYPPLGYPYPVTRKNDELQQRGLYKDFRRPNFHSSDSGLHNYVPSFNPAFIGDFKHYPLIAGTNLMPQHVPLSHEPVSSYVDKLNVGKGIEFFFKK
ncbi:hypothetical protein O6H91_05G042500 [Diphasiastrum complanatum]|uniref:Uncharacterized protein n=2 Tax=Diphasiastrum complanatum TaxID=34168 RepID=A0ACC2DMT7_DIPCM|nr:hypothetical protein O6H91_05G042500 [Diphasiastrum complanatum]KAJ7555516.1 hypothetical protein O6H91_05G042500 [Diphasiastrum complanatum]